MTLLRLKPEAPRYCLLAAAGLMWSAVGVMLCGIAWRWLSSSADMFRTAATVLAGVAGAWIVYRFGFSKIAAKNIERLSLLPERACFFAFQAWKSYAIIAFMILLGITLRHSAIPRYYLAVVYITIGGALFLSSFLYHIRLWRILCPRP